MKIGNNKIGEGNPCYIIAEAGVNHNGDMALAKKLVDAAVEAKADAVKFQTFKAELLVTEDADQAEYQKETAKDDSQFAMLKKLELKEDDFAELKKYCDDKGIEFLSTPHSDTWSVDILEKLDMKAYKIGSGDITNIPILEYIAKLGKPILLSIGMSDMEEIEEAVEAIKKQGNDKIIILQCTSMYPCPNDKANVRVVETLKSKMDDIIGYSDHTIGMEASIISACLGANVVEKHFTLDRKMKGPDHRASADPEELKLIVKGVKFVEENKITNPEEAFSKLNEMNFNLNSALIEEILGNKEKKPESEELEVAKVARKSIVALKDISNGEEMTEENIGIRRPGEGLAPKYYDQVKGKKANNDIKKNSYIKLEDVE